MVLSIILLVLTAFNLFILIFLLRSFSKKETGLEYLDKNIEKTERSFREEIAKNREEMANSLKNFGDSVEKKFTDSFKSVSDMLGSVHKGIGEMQSLATGVGDLKKVLTNIKVRGVWGEIQLGTLLDQILTPDQYEKNVATKKGSAEIVEFAIKLPGKDGNITWIPIDAKFPKEDYERLIAAQEQANPVLVEEVGKELENKIKLEAKSIRDKYIDPPNTTDFGILFLPIEGLYAEVLRRPGLSEFLQNKYRILIAGPTTIAAFLNSLQMGFRTLAIEKRAGEVWNLLAAVKAEFGKFGDILDKTHKKIREAGDTIEDASRKSRTIERKLKNVEALSNAEAVKLVEHMEEIGG